MALNPSGWKQHFRKKMVGMKYVESAAQKRHVKRINEKIRPWSLKLGFFKHCLRKMIKRQAAFVLRRTLLPFNGFQKELRMLGCTETQFLAHIESQFHSGMTWTGYPTIWTLSPIRGSQVNTDLSLKQNQWFFRYDNWRPKLKERPLDITIYHLIDETRKSKRRTL